MRIEKSKMLDKKSQKGAHNKVKQISQHFSAIYFSNSNWTAYHNEKTITYYSYLNIILSTK